MQVQVPFSNDQIEDMAVSALTGVFQTMLDLSIELTSQTVLDNSEGARAQTAPTPIETDEIVVAGSVGFIGSLSGVIFIYLKESLAKKLTCKMLHMEPADLEEEGPDTVNDAMGEMTNMTAGSFKNQLCDMGYNCRLTIPSILRGNHFQVEKTPNPEIKRIAYRFNTEGEEILIDLLMKA